MGFTEKRPGQIRKDGTRGTDHVPGAVPGLRRQGAGQDLQEEGRRRPLVEGRGGQAGVRPVDRSEAWPGHRGQVGRAVRPPGGASSPHNQGPRTRTCCGSGGCPLSGSALGRPHPPGRPPRGRGHDGQAGPQDGEHELRRLRAVINAAVEADLIGRTPCRGIKLPKIPKSKIKVLTAEELGRLADAMPPEYRAMVWLAGGAGLRLSEVAGLRLSQVDILGGTLRVNHTVKESDGKLIIEDEVKTAASRQPLPLAPIIVEQLVDHITRVGLIGAPENSYLFTAPAGGPIRATSFSTPRVGPGSTPGRARRPHVPRAPTHHGGAVDRHRRPPQGHPGADAALLDQGDLRCVRAPAARPRRRRHDQPGQGAATPPRLTLGLGAPGMSKARSTRPGPASDFPGGGEENRTPDLYVANVAL